MALTTLQRLRLRIADRAKVTLDETLGIGDGVVTEFQMHLAPVVSGSESLKLVAGGVATPQTRDVDYVINNDLGLVTFTAAPADSTQVRASYQHTTFTDTELNDLLDQQNDSVARAAIRAIEWLLADTDRFIKYTFGQESVDRSSVREGLNDLLTRLERQVGSGLVALVKADTEDREDLMAPFIDDEVELDNAWTIQT
jgi:hypothetical protein